MQDSDFLSAVAAEAKKARAKFPMPNKNFAALSEEVGELAKALLEEPVENVRAEAIQVATMAMRVATEGDPSITDDAVKVRDAQWMQAIAEIWNPSNNGHHQQSNSWQLGYCRALKTLRDKMSK